MQSASFFLGFLSAIFPVKRPFLTLRHFLTLLVIGGVFSASPCWKIAISPEPNLRWTSDLSVNSTLSVAVQEKKTRAPYLSWLKRGGPMKFETTFFQIAKLRFSTTFDKIPEFSKNCQRRSFKPAGLTLLRR